ncbi:MAG TPA: hypothetical protein VM597_08255 [Gemmataceae bacterium]|nr:hypothetical protein [Gemmataceae bacterium]
MLHRCFAATIVAVAVVVPAKADDVPLTLSVSTLGLFAQGNSWYLSVNSAGQAELTILGGATDTRKQFQVPKEQWAEFRKIVADGRFFELGREYGESVPDGSQQTITVTAGQHTHTVKLQFLSVSTPAERAKVREASGAIRLLVLVRGWFNETEAVDLRKIHEAILDKAKE